MSCDCTSGLSHQIDISNLLPSIPKEVMVDDTLSHTAAAALLRALESSSPVAKTCASMSLIFFCSSERFAFL